MRAQPLALLDTVHGRELMMVHAGVLPSWTPAITMSLAAEVGAMMTSAQFHVFLTRMYGDAPTRWHDGLRGTDRLRTIVNVLTRLRFCTANDEMEFDTKDGAAAAPTGFFPWFDAPQRQTASATVAFGHWSTLGWLGRSDVLSLDSGCVWGGHLSAVRVDAGAAGGPLKTTLIQVPCGQAQRPGT